MFKLRQENGNLNINGLQNNEKTVGRASTVLAMLLIFVNAVIIAGGVFFFTYFGKDGAMQGSWKPALFALLCFVATIASYHMVFLKYLVSVVGSAVDAAVFGYLLCTLIGSRYLETSSFNFRESMLSAPVYLLLFVVFVSILLQYFKTEEFASYAWGFGTKYIVSIDNFVRNRKNK